MELINICTSIFLYVTLLSLGVVNGTVQKVLKNINSGLANPFITFPPMTMFNTEYDFIIVGCGSSGSLLANRLTEVPSFQVLCIEAGGKENFWSDMPLTAFTLPQTPLDWNYKAEYQVGSCEGFLDKKCFWPRGKVLGGSSVINYMMYNRGNKKDYDGWSKLGNYGWSFKEVLPYFMKFENFKALNLENTTNHGLDGELNIEYARYQSRIVPYLIASAAEQGVPQRDINGDQQIGITRIQGMLREGTRCTGAKAFLFGIHTRPNLHIATKAFVKKIIIDPATKIATGVEFEVFNVTHTVNARKEVLVSAGSINSPQLLMLSGIGPACHLKEKGIRVIQDLQVGKNLQDHVMFPALIFLTEKPPSVLDPLFVPEYFLEAKGVATVTGGCEIFAWVNTRNKTLDCTGIPPDVPDHELIFTGLLRDGFVVVGRALTMTSTTFNEFFSPILGKNAYGIFPVLMTPKSVGYIELRSSNAYDRPKIFPNYFKEEADLDAHVRGIRFAIRIGLGKAMSKFKPKLYKFAISQCTDHTFGSDHFWKCAVRTLAHTLYHPVGTCKMGPSNDPNAVVDPELRVRGIKNLRVVDASIMPKIVNGHTTSACYMIAEKAADLIKQKYL